MEGSQGRLGQILQGECPKVVIGLEVQEQMLIVVVEMEVLVAVLVEA